WDSPPCPLGSPLRSFLILRGIADFLGWTILLAGFDIPWIVILTLPLELVVSPLCCHFDLVYLAGQEEAEPHAGGKHRLACGSGIRRRSSIKALCIIASTAHILGGLRIDAVFLRRRPRNQKPRQVPAMRRLRQELGRKCVV